MVDLLELTNDQISETLNLKASPSYAPRPSTIVILKNTGLWVMLDDKVPDLLIKELIAKFTLKKWIYAQNKKGRYQYTPMAFNPKSNMRLLQLPRFGALNLLETEPDLCAAIGLYRENITNNLDTVPKALYITPEFTKDHVITRGWAYTGTPMKHQEIAVDHIMNNIYTEANLLNGTCGTTLLMGTGTGKTDTIQLLISRLAARHGTMPTLIVCPNTTLVDQWKLELAARSTYLVGDAQIDGDVLVMTIHSLFDLAKDKFSFKFPEPWYSSQKTQKNATTIEYSADQFITRFGLIVYEEVHQISTESFGEVFLRFQAPYMIGISADPKRRDNYSDMIPWFVGPVFNPLEIVSYKDQMKDAIKFTGKIEIIKYHSNNKQAQQRNGDFDWLSTIAVLEADKARTMMIAGYVSRLIDEDHDIYVFGHHVEYLEKLKHTIVALRAKSRPNIVISTTENAEAQINQLHGKIKRDLRNDVSNVSDVILTTYIMCGTGKTLPRMTAIIFATPQRNNYNQYVGRIFRPNMVNPECNQIPRIIVDIVDVGLPGLEKQFSQARLLEYKRQADQGRTLAFVERTLHERQFMF